MIRVDNNLHINPHHIVSLQKHEDLYIKFFVSSGVALTTHAFPDTKARNIAFEEYSDKIAKETKK